MAERAVLTARGMSVRGVGDMSFIAFTEQVINGLIIGVFYALAAVGLSIIFGVLRIVNFAHGELYMFGGYAYYLLVANVGVPPVLAVPLAGALLFATGIVLERTLIQPIHLGTVERPDEYSIMITFGVAILMQNLALGIFGPWTMRAEAIASGRISIGELIIGGDRLVAAGIGLVLIAIVLYVLRYTWTGKAVRAVSQDRESSAVLGIDVDRIGQFAFGLGATLAGVAGALMGPVFLVYPTMGVIPAIKAYVVIVLGGLGSLQGAIVGALLLGQVENLASVLIPDTSRALAYKDAYGLALLVLVLLVRPQGLLGEKARRL